MSPSFAFPPAPVGCRRARLRRAAALLGLALATAGCGGASTAPPAVPSATAPAQSDLLRRLQAIPGVTATPIATLPGFTESVQVDFLQPVEHGDPARGTFAQRFLLSHRGEDRPTVFYTSGYGISRNFEPELSALLQANQILLVHRFFAGATPEPRDWRDLTIRQAAADQHRIRDAMRSLYAGAWVSTGGSKGGMTALFYRRFFPEDVAATVAYVAPLMERPDDPRFTRFLREQVGDRACRERLAAFQRRVLERRTELLPLFRQYDQSQGYRFTIVPEGAAFEYSVLEYPFAFWQYGSDTECVSVPREDASDGQVLEHLLTNSPSSYYADSGFLTYQPLFYQAYTETGYCTYEYAHLQDLLREVPEPTYRTFAPRDAQMTFRPEVMADVLPWLRHQGERIVYIYGGNDPWTAGALEPDRSLDALMVVQPGANHRVRISDLDRRAEVVAALQGWLSVDITDAGLAAATRAPAWERF
jgi:hypothetical protein